MADSQLLKRDIESLISFVGQTPTQASESSTWSAARTQGIDEIQMGMMWQFVDTVYERSMEPCLRDICDRLYRLRDQRVTIGL